MRGRAVPKEAKRPLAKQEARQSRCAMSAADRLFRARPIVAQQAWRGAGARLGGVDIAAAPCQPRHQRAHLLARDKKSVNARDTMRGDHSQTHSFASWHGSAAARDRRAVHGCAALAREGRRLVDERASAGGSAFALRAQADGLAAARFGGLAPQSAHCLRVNANGSTCTRARRAGSASGKRYVRVRATWSGVRGAASAIGRGTGAAAAADDDDGDDGARESDVALSAARKHARGVGCARGQAKRQPTARLGTASVGYTQICAHAKHQTKAPLAAAAAAGFLVASRRNWPAPRASSSAVAAASGPSSARHP